MRERLIVITSTVCAALAIPNGSAFGALPLAQQGPTVDDYTAAQSSRAEAAAQRAGFDDLEIVMVQDHNFFLDGQKQGEKYSITVTPEGNVYPSSPSHTPKS